MFNSERVIDETDVQLGGPLLYRRIGHKHYLDELRDQISVGDVVGTTDENHQHVDQIVQPGVR